MRRRNPSEDERLQELRRSILQGDIEAGFEYLGRASRLPELTENLKPGERVLIGVRDFRSTDKGRDWSKDITFLVIATVRTFNKEFLFSLSVEEDGLIVLFGPTVRRYDYPPSIFDTKNEIVVRLQ